MKRKKCQDLLLLIRLTVGHTTSLEYCDTLVGREKMAHDHKYQIHWSLAHLITGFKRGRADRGCCTPPHSECTETGADFTVWPSVKCSNLCGFCWFFFIIIHLKGHLVIRFCIWTHHKKHTRTQKPVRLWRDSGTAHSLFVFLPSCYKNVISECSVTSSLNGFQPWDYFSIEYGVYG